MRTAREVGAEIMNERELFLAAELAGDRAEADQHEAAMNRALEEYMVLPAQRLPSEATKGRPPQSAY